MSIPTLSANPTRSEIQAAITAIVQNIAYLQAELTKLRGGAGSIAAFVQDLHYGLLEDPQVKKLQGLLVSRGYLGTGLDTGNYLSKTVQAVKAYQQAKGITPVNGRFGPQTRQAMNTDLGL